MASLAILCEPPHSAVDSIGGRVEWAHRVCTMVQFFAPQIFTETVRSFFGDSRPNLKELAEGQEEKEGLPLFGKDVLTGSTVIAKAAA